jgi:peptide/nickel transport system substrate-binding protein
MTLRRTLLAATLLASFAVPAMAQKSADTLRVVERSTVTNVDPYYNSLRSGLILTHQTFDGLIYRDPDGFVLKPALATAWRFIDDVTIEFDLRRGVRFHNGDPFTADDVVYTLNLVSNPDSRVATPANYSWIKEAEKIDDFTVRLHLKAPFPAALQYLAFVTPIYPKAYRERVGPEGFSRAPIGTGPYRIVRVDQAKQVDLERWDGYYEGAPKPRPAIGKIQIRYVPDAATEMTELLAGRADYIWNFNPDQFERIRQHPRLTAQQQETMRVAFLMLDAAGRTGADNPLTKQKVRQAIWHAVNRKEMAERLVRGGSRVPDAPCFPTQFGCDQEAAVVYEYDPEKAKRLLAEAGYPDGFETELVSYIQPTQWTAAVQGYLQAVGIRARVSQLQVQAVIQRSWAGTTPLYMGSWGSYSINDVSAIMPNFMGRGANDDYSRDPDIHRWLEEGGSTNDVEKRLAAYRNVIRRATEQAYWLPLFTYVSYYAHTRDLDFTPYPDEMPRWYRAKWN